MTKPKIILKHKGERVLGIDSVGCQGASVKTGWLPVVVVRSIYTNTTTSHHQQRSTWDGWMRAPQFWKGKMEANFEHLMHGNFAGNGCEKKVLKK